MNQEERNQIGEQWFLISAMHGRPLEKPTIRYMLDQIADLPFDKVLWALAEWGKNAKVNRHPTPAEIREKVYPKTDPETEARESAALILEKVQTLGAWHPERAMEELGPFIWKIVIRWGGWSYICEHLGTPKLPLTTFNAQTRDMALSMLKRDEAGLTGTVPTLGTGAPESALPESSEKVKKLLDTYKTKEIPE